MLKHGAAVKLLMRSEGCINHEKKEEYVGVGAMEEGSTVMLLLLDAPTMPSLEEFVGVIEQSSKSKMQQGRLRQSIKEEERRTLLQCSHFGRRSIELKN